jgi:acyl-[acyl-carrier-protein]-phospholipid O-acyltransferase/long-chain-fatty-acid--[acyl-carrier-protein] ligase
MEGYGTTEASPLLSSNTNLFYKKNTAGKLLPDLDYILEPVDGIESSEEDTRIGLLKVKGPNLMQGYLLEGIGFVPLDGYYDTGDVVAVDAEGYIQIRSRVKRFAKISGEMISLDAVEKAVSACFDMAKTAAVNVRDEKRGEKIIVYIVREESDRRYLREYWQKTGQSMLSMPEKLVAVDELPLLGNGKVNYVVLKERAMEEGKDVEA